MSANDRQVGGNHYHTGGEQHWDRIYRLYGAGYFIGCITKYVERYAKKGGKLDLQKAAHYLEKLIELEFPDQQEQTIVGVASMTIREGDAVAFREMAAGLSQLGSAMESFRLYEKNSPQWVQDGDFQCEGGFGNGLNVYRCLHCRAFVNATGLTEAHSLHNCTSKPR